METVKAMKIVKRFSLQWPTPRSVCVMWGILDEATSQVACYETEGVQERPGVESDSDAIHWISRDDRIVKKERGSNGGIHLG